MRKARFGRCRKLQSPLGYLLGETTPDGRAERGCITAAARVEHWGNGLTQKQTRERESNHFFVCVDSPNPPPSFFFFFETDSGQPKCFVNYIIFS